MHRAASRGGVFEPEQLEILQRVFDQTCIERGLFRVGIEAENLAAVIMGFFHIGIMTEADLRMVLKKKLDIKPSEILNPHYSSALGKKD